VKWLNAIKNFGAMDVLCTDKTGTPTLNRVIPGKHLDIHGREDSQVLEFDWLSSFHQTGLKTLLDVAVLEYAEYRITNRSRCRGGLEIGHVVRQRYLQFGK